MRCKACNALLKDWEIEVTNLLCFKCSGESYKQVYPEYPGLNIVYYPDDPEEDQDTSYPLPNSNKLKENI